MRRPKFLRFPAPAPVAFCAFTLLSLLAGCGKGALPSCPGEDERTRTGGTLPELHVGAVSGPAARGALISRPEGQQGPQKIILLLDYSGSMYAGYGKDQVAGCARCAAGLVHGRPSRTVASRTQPYYVATPDFQQFLARWLDAAVPDEGGLGLEVLLFNGRVFRLGGRGAQPLLPGMALPFERRLSRASAAEVASWLRQIPANPFEVDRLAPLATDSSAALHAALDALGRDEAVIWLITDNIVDAEGGTEGALADPEARRTADFYRELDAEPRVQMITAYPIFRAEACSWMCGTSLFTYGMYISPFERPDSAEFHRLGGTTPEGGGPTAGGLLWNLALQKLAAEYSGGVAAVGRADLAGVPLRLKPIDTEALTIHFGRPALRCARAEFGQELRCQARIEVRNILRHQNVESAKLRLSNEILLPRKEGGRSRLPWASAICPGQVETLDWRVQGGSQGRGIDPIEIGPLAPLQEVAVDVRFKLPAVAVDTSRRSTLLDIARTNRIVLDGLLRAEIRDFRTSLAIDPGSFASVYGSAQLPVIFRKREVGSVSAAYRIDALLANDGQALAQVVLLGLGGAGALCALVAMRFQRKQFTVYVDGIESARVSLPRFSSHEIEVLGVVRALLRRGWAPDYRLVPRRGVRVRREGPVWVLRVGDDIGQEHRIEVRRGWSSARSKAPVASRMDNW
ncbi:MAG: hypothetical protein M3O15_01300 [Acidobacteriota bacterium]|nr:hypothetical protein [Acidobacteriota bacterium]